MALIRLGCPLPLGDRLKGGRVEAARRVDDESAIRARHSGSFQYRVRGIPLGPLFLFAPRSAEILLLTLFREFVARRGN